MNRLDAFFATGRQAFVPYVTAGYPSVRDTVDILRLLVASGADVIELGFPFSDPIADGPVIQAASQQALAAGFRRDDYFAIVSEFRRHDPATPLVAFTYYNPVFNLGGERFARTRSRRDGVAGGQARGGGGGGRLVGDVGLGRRLGLSFTLHAEFCVLLYFLVDVEQQADLFHAREDGQFLGQDFIQAGGV
jgi:hypothetical protein